MNSQLLDKAFTRKRETDVAVTYNWRVTVEGRMKEEDSLIKTSKIVWPYDWQTGAAESCLD